MFGAAKPFQRVQICRVAELQSCILGGQLDDTWMRPPAKADNRSQHSNRRVLGWTLVVFAIAAIIYWLVPSSSTRTLSRQGPPQKAIADEARVSLPLPAVNGTYETIEGVEMVFQSPPSPKAALLLFHGCQHSSTDWWPKSEGCAPCTGLPEEMRITDAALAAGFIAVALSSQDRTGSRCWDTGWPPEQSNDIPKVMLAVRALMKRQKWSDLPLYALGGSSGGALVLLLALRMRLQGVCCQIMAVPPHVLQSKPEDEAGNTWKYPPTAMVHMARDKHTAHGVTEMHKVLADQGVAVLEVEVQPQPLTPHFFSTRTKDIIASVSSAIHSTFLSTGLLDESGFLQDDPRQTSTEWQQLLKQNVPAVKDMNLKVDQSTIHEELNLAYAGHELISDNISNIFDFFHSQTADT